MSSQTLNNESLIEKLMKENEELKKENENLKKEIKELRADITGLTKNDIKEMEEQRKNLTCDYEKVWKPFVNIEGYADYPCYEFSNWGECRNAKTKKSLGTIQKDGYVKLTLHEKGLPQLPIPMHRAVALVFGLEHDEDQTFVDHIDHQRWNNSISNLRWTTPEENNNNKGSFKGKEFEWKDNLSENSISIATIKTSKGTVHEFDDIFYDDGSFWKAQDERYKKLTVSRNNRGNEQISVKPKGSHSSTTITLKTIKKQYDIED